MHQSIATIDSPEFINLQPVDINPLMSKCEIKVFYLGKNRNRSLITKDVALEMAKTLRGAPIVGYYKSDKGDFDDHGERIVLDDEGVHFNCLTKPYGFVAPDALVWFKKFRELDDSGDPVIREYLMTTGYLWTGQFEECKSVLQEGKPHSMELDDNTLRGHSVKDENEVDFFIINDAIFSKLCILGDDVEPCFEGSSVTAPAVSSSFALDSNFKNTLYNMIQDMQKIVSKGGERMEEIDIAIVDEYSAETTDFVENEVVEEVVTVNDEEAPAAEPEVEFEAPADESTDNSVTEEVTVVEEAAVETPEEEFKCKDKEKEPEKKYTDEEYETLQAQYSALEAEVSALREFKRNIELKEKQDLIDGFYMLTAEDKQDVQTNINSYSYDDIEAKLSVICVRKKVNFDLDDTQKNDNNTEEQNVNTFNLNSVQTETNVPEWVTALKNARIH